MNTKQLSELKKVLNEKLSGDKEIPESQRKMYLDPAKVLGVIPKTEDAKAKIESFFEVEGVKVPELDYSVEHEKDITTSKYSIEYLQIILTFITKSNDESVKISTKRDYPLKLETSEYILILAPRVNTD